MTKRWPSSPPMSTGFLKESQPARWQALEALLGPKTSLTVLDSLSKELELKGTLHVLRHGFKCYGKTFRMAWFRPNTRMNPEAAENYARNRLTVTRQVGFTSVMKNADGKNRRCVIDVTLAVNGIPVVTAELKNPLTGQRAVGRDAAIPERAGRARSSLRFQETRARPLRGGPGRGVDDDRIEGAGRPTSCPSTAATATGRATRRSRGTGRPTTFGTRCCKPTACWKSCNASCTSK